jgi:2,3-bisphosphoglycerate-independent phosphoglycerate mutase
MRLLFFFLDGVGLGSDDPAVNPLARMEMPNLQALLDGQQLLQSSAPLETSQATLLALDACLGVPGLPQSATGQASLLSGINVPGEIGYHYGPKPNPEVASFLNHGNLFTQLQNQGRQVDFLNAYPPRYFEGIQSGRRIFSSIPLAVIQSGLRLKTEADLSAGLAVSADFTGQGWRDHLGIPNIPVLSPAQAGRQLARLAQANDFSFFEYWLSDYAGHRQDMQAACALLADLDAVLGGLLEAWDLDQDLILITSDHGNLEDLSTRRHTYHAVPLLLVGVPHLRRKFLQSAPGKLADLTGLAPAILKSLANETPAAA